MFSVTAEVYEGAPIMTTVRKWFWRGTLKWEESPYLTQTELQGNSNEDLGLGGGIEPEVNANGEQSHTNMLHCFWTKGKAAQLKKDGLFNSAGATGHAEAKKKEKRELWPYILHKD